MPTIRPRLGRLGKVAAPTAAVLGASLAFAAFTDDASNNGNQATAASVTITEDVPATSALFNLGDMRPSDPVVERCIGVTNAGSIAVPLTMRLSGSPAGTGLASYISMTVERGTRTTSTDDSTCGDFVPAATGAEFYNGTLAGFPTTTGGALSDGGAALAVGQERAYRIRWDLQDDEAAEGKSVSGVNFVWTSSS